MGNNLENNVVVRRGGGLDTYIRSDSCIHSRADKVVGMAAVFDSVAKIAYYSGIAATRDPYYSLRPD